MSSTNYLRKDVYNLSYTNQDEQEGSLTFPRTAVAEYRSNQESREDQLSSKDVKQLAEASAQSNLSDKHSGIISDILALIECPVCLKVSHTPMILCVRGHNVCENCYTKLNPRKCPICRGKFSEGRNYVVGAIAIRLCEPCKYAGCKETMLPDQLEEHQEVCKFRPHHCPVEDCRISFNFANLLAHFQELHSSQIDNIVVPDPKATKFRKIWQTTLYTDKTNSKICQLGNFGLIMLHLVIDPAGCGMMYFQHLCPPKEHCRVVATLHVYNENGKKILSFFLEAAPVDTNPKKLPLKQCAHICIMFNGSEIICKSTLRIWHVKDSLSLE